MHPRIPLIEVQGKGAIATPPDLLVLTVTVHSLDKDYGRSLDDLNLRLDLLRKAVAAAGCEPEDLKTKAFSIREQNDYVNSRYVFHGFAGTHALEFRIPLADARMKPLFSSLLGSKAKASLSLHWTVADEESVKQRVFEAAVVNAKARGEIIARAAGHRLGRIVHIHQGYAEVRISSEGMAFGAPEAGISPAPDIAPAEIESEDTVQITWELE